jgi:nicotinamidase-related amidase
VTADGLAIHRDRAALLIVDIQERLSAAMPPAPLAQAVRNAATLIELARRMAMPIVVSQQYPKGLGSTVAAIEDALAPQAAPAHAPQLALHRLDKVAFSVCGDPAFASIWDAVGRDQWIVAGMETHVCVYQTARDLAGRGASVHVAADAVVSRTRANWQVGLDLCARAGAVVTATEVVVFDALGRAGGDDFKALSRRIR